MKKSYLIVIFCFISEVSFSQDSTLIGRFSTGLLGSYSKSNISDELAKGGFAIQFRYFPIPKAAFSLTYQNIRSSVDRFQKTSQGFNSSLSFGFEKHVPFGSFSPYIGLEVGLNITRVESELIQLPSNIKYFQNNLPNYLFRPKAGVFYKINDNLLAHFEGTFNWVISADRNNANPLFDDSYTAIYFGRKVPTISVGIHYLFNE